eukprot:COSAG05_NODE_17_length_35518_cov_34.728084_19_plen_102_part_00
MATKTIDSSRRQQGSIIARTNTIEIRAEAGSSSADANQGRAPNPYSPGPDPVANRFLDYACRGLCMHNLSHSESSGNHAVKIYAQCMNYRIYAKILNSLST